MQVFATGGVRFPVLESRPRSAGFRRAAWSGGFLFLSGAAPFDPGGMRATERLRPCGRPGPESAPGKIGASGRSTQRSTWPNRAPGIAKSGTGQGKMSDRVIFPPQEFRGRPGWTADDLNEIRQAVERLALPGAALETGWGTSDEGDPWFAVTDAGTGELILHLTRLNNSFIAVAPALGGSLHARDLRTLINESIRRLLGRNADTSRPA